MTRQTVDHTPGGSPATPAERAPSTVRHSFTTTPNGHRRNPAAVAAAGEYIRPVDLLSAEVRPSSEEGKSVTVWRGYCMAAARLSLKGARWSEDDRVECAGEVAAHIMGQRASARRGTPAEVLAWIDYVERFPVTARRMEDAIPKSAVRMSYLCQLAANWRRAVEASRARDAADLERRVVADGFTTHGATTEDSAEGAETVGAYSIRWHDSHAPAMAQPHGRPADVLRYLDRVETIRDTHRQWPAAWGAFLNPRPRAVKLGGQRQRAMDLLAALGLPRLGASYPAAMGAVVAADGQTSADLAALWNVDRKTAEKRVIRAAARVPSRTTHSYMDHADIIGVTAELPSAHHGASARETEPRTAAHDRAECQCAEVPMGCPVHPVTASKQRATRRPWDGKQRAAWTTTLPDSTRARLATAAAIRAGRRASESDRAGRVR